MNRPFARAVRTKKQKNTALSFIAAVLKKARCNKNTALYTAAMNKAAAVTSAPRSVTPRTKTRQQLF
jgi:hypothetical protein